MIYGNQWDRVMNWLEETGAKTQEEVYQDSSSWGNYSNYNTSNPEHQVDGAGEDILPSGTSEYWKANNIYDLAGNANEYTQERTFGEGEHTVFRGRIMHRWYYSGKWDSASCC